MFKTQITLFAGLLLIAACDQNKSSETVSEAPATEILYEEIFESLDNCNPDSLSCTWAKISYPVFADTSKVGLNNLILDYVHASLSAYVQTGDDGTKDVRLAVTEFLDDYRKFKNEFNDYNFGWYIQVQAEILYNQKGLFSLKVDSETFTGGAHPNTTSSLLIADANSASILTARDIISDTTAFKKSLEAAFRELKGLMPETTFADAGYYINDGDFILNDNIGMTSDKIIVHYNPYEIAPYSLGPTTIELDREKIKDLLASKNQL